MPKKIEPVAVYNLEREIHMMNDLVAVVWNTKEVLDTAVINGRTYQTSISTRDGEPYIDFVAVRLYDKGTKQESFAEREDSPADGGIDIETAQIFIEGLEKAIAYIENKDYA